MEETTMLKKARSKSAAMAAIVVLAAVAAQGHAQAQPAAPKLDGSYRCEPEPSSCQWSGQTFTIDQSGTRLDMKNDKGDVAQGLLSSKLTLSVGAPWNMLGVILPDNRIQWSNGTVWRKE
jgi:hypothetical protein